VNVNALPAMPGESARLNRKSCAAGSVAAAACLGVRRSTGVSAAPESGAHDDRNTFGGLARSAACLGGDGHDGMGRHDGNEI